MRSSQIGLEVGARKGFVTTRESYGPGRSGASHPGSGPRQAWKAGQKDRQPERFLEFTDVTLKTVCPVEAWEHISFETRGAETMILGLRLLDGLNLAEASHQADADLESVYAEQIRELLGLGLLERHQEVLRLTGGAYLIANQVFTRFVE